VYFCSASRQRHAPQYRRPTLARPNLLRLPTPYPPVSVLFPSSVVNVNFLRLFLFSSATASCHPTSTPNTRTSKSLLPLPTPCAPISVLFPSFVVDVNFLRVTCSAPRPCHAPQHRRPTLTRPNLLPGPILYLHFIVRCLPRIVYLKCLLLFLPRLRDSGMPPDMAHIHSHVKIHYPSPPIFAPTCVYVVCCKG